MRGRLASRAVGGGRDGIRTPKPFQARPSPPAPRTPAPKLLCKGVKSVIFWRSKRQNQILEEKSIMDEQIKKPISRTIIVAIEKAPGFPTPPLPQY